MRATLHLVQATPRGPASTPHAHRRAVPHPSGMVEHVPADATGRTDVPGVRVAGNATDLSAQVGASAAAGAVAGAHINADLVTEETRAAVATARRR